MGIKLRWVALGIVAFSVLVALKGSFANTSERVLGFFFLATTLMIGCVVGILIFARVIKMGLPLWAIKWLSSIMSGVIAASVGVLMTNLIWRPLWQHFTYGSIYPQTQFKADMMLQFMGAAFSFITGFLFGAGVGQEIQGVVSDSSNEI